MATLRRKMAATNEQAIQKMGHENKLAVVLGRLWMCIGFHSKKKGDGVIFCHTTCGYKRKKNAGEISQWHRLAFWGMQSLILIYFPCTKSLDSEPFEDGNRIRIALMKSWWSGTISKGPPFFCGVCLFIYFPVYNHTRLANTQFNFSDRTACWKEERRGDSWSKKPNSMCLLLIGIAVGAGSHTVQCTLTLIQL